MKSFFFFKMFTTQQGWSKPAAICLAVVSLWILFFSNAAFSQVTAPVVSCESLAGLKLREATVTMAETVPAGGFEMPVENDGRGGGMRGPFGSTDPDETPGFCRVAVTMTPSAESDIKMELWLPTTTWNGKFFGAGNWGWGGSIRYDGLLLGVKDGYASASNDTGHTSADGPMGQFALDHPDKVVDYGYRANHEMTLQAKEIIGAYYGTGPSRSYWVGCSLGGQQALTEAQRFPNDYDGIVAGAPANPIVRLNAWQIWPSVLTSRNPDRAISREKMTMVNQAIVDRCDELDGVKDGILENPLACRFDPKELLCEGEDATDCLTAPQVELLEKMYEGLVDSRTGEVLHAPMAPGGAGSLSGGSPMGVALDLYRYMIYQDPDWDWTALDPETDIDFGEKVLRTVNVGTNANLKPFFDRGGKLLMYHGWQDGNSPEESFNYYKAVLETVGPETENSMRVFAVPGMGHCSGGVGCDSFDKLAAIDGWLETGKAPDRIEASKVEDGKAVRTHPLCAYPKVAVYKGTGSTDDTANFVCTEVPISE